MVLLTPSAISAAISSGVVFLFTTALFLSGYVLQQKTVEGLRQQIREPPRQAHTYRYLPEKFAHPDLESVDEVDVRPGISAVQDPTADSQPKRDTLRTSEDPSLEGLSRAERRRRIKQDIEEATRADREGYHRRTY